MNSNKTIEAIKANDLFKDLDFESLEIPFDAKNFAEFKEGDFIFSAGQPSEFLYLLINGEVKIKLNSIKRLFFKSPNEFFGENEVLQKESRDSSAVANSDCLVYKLDEALVGKLVNDSSAIRSILLFDDKKSGDENLQTHVQEEVDKKISEAEHQSEPAKIDINDLSDSTDFYEPGIGSVDINEPVYQPEPELEPLIHEGYNDNTSKSFNSQIYNYSEETDSSVITDESIDSIADEKEIMSFNLQKTSSSESNEAINYKSDDLDFSNQTPPVEYLNKNDEASELSKLANFIMQDVKAPLLTVKHYSSLLSRFDLSEEVKKVVMLISAQTNSVIDLLQASIDFSEQNIKNKMEEISFNELMSNNLTLLSDYVESRNVKLFKKLDEDVKINIDARKLYVACYYLARFSCDLMKQGGNLYVSSKVEKDSVKLNLKDDNKILNSNNLNDAHNVNFSHDGVSKTGLSLAISKFLLESMDCKLEINSSGTETNYIVSIPVPLY
jgi:hypothetical protein